MVRMHVTNTFTDLLGMYPERMHQVRDSMLQITEQGKGVLVLLNNEGSLEDRTDSNPNIIRQYGIGAQILRTLGIRDIRLLTNSGTPKLIGLEGYELKISETIPIKSPEKI